MGLSKTFRLRACAVAGLLIAGGAANAAQPTSAERFSVIAGGHHLERWCKHLTPAERGELQSITSHAEIVAARDLGAERVREITAGAREFADQRGSDCGEETERAVRLSLNVARDFARNETVSAADQAPVTITPDPTAPEPRTEPEQSREEDRTATAPAEEAVREERSSANDLDRFGAQTQAYYVQRRCSHLAYRDDLHFWKLIAHQHKVMVRRHGGRAVARMQRAAEAAANARSFRCGQRSRRMVRRGYASLRQDLRGTY